MNWINETFGTEFSTQIQLGIMFVALLVALLIILWLFRKISGTARSRIARSRQPRLGVVEAAIVDDTRRLVLVRRDNVEHLLMIGGPGDVVVETNIQKTPQARQQAPEQRTAQRAAAPIQDTPETGPREPRLIEPTTDSGPQAAAPQPMRREIVPAAETAPVAAGAAGTAAIVADKTVQAAARVEAVVEEPSLEAPSIGIDALEADAASDAGELAQELAGDLTDDLDMAASDLADGTDDSISPQMRDTDAAADTEEDMRKLLDELAGGKS